MLPTVKTIGWISLLLLPRAEAAFNAGYSYPMTDSVEEAVLETTNFSSSSNLYSPVIPREDLVRALDDFEGRVDPQFSVPPSIRPSVDFWLQIYTELTTQHVVLFDDRHPEVIYEVLDFRDLAQKRPRAYFYLRRLEVQKKLNAYQAAFQKLNSTRGRFRGSAEARRIVEAVEALSPFHRRHSFIDFQANLRAQTGQRDAVIRGLLRADPYLPVMEQIFADHFLPSDLALLSLLESSFETHATSRVGAKGIWQFMENPGKKFLLINEARRLDERLSPLKSTLAAAQLLQQNKRLVGTWAGAITAYNSGPRAITRRGRWTREDDQVWRAFVPCTSSIGWAGRNYYPGFLAIVRAIRYRDVFFGRAPEPALKVVKFEPTPRRMSLLDFAWEKGVSIQTLKGLNPDVPNLSGKLPKGFRVAMPTETDLFDRDRAGTVLEEKKL